MKVMLNGLKKMQKLNYKVLILTAFVSANASANIFNDVGDWVSDNKGTTAMIGIGALATASVVVKPLKWLQDLVDTEGEEMVSTEILAGAEARGNSLESLASKLNVEEDQVLEGAVGGIPNDVSWTPALDNVAGSLRADGYSEAQILHILDRDTELLSKPIMRDSGGLIEGVEKNKPYFTVKIENPNERIVDPSGLLKDENIGLPKGEKLGVLKGARGVLKGVRGVFRGVKDDRL